MLITLNTTTDQQATAPGQGNYLFIKSATGPFRVTVWLSSGRSQDVELRARNQIRFDEDIESLELLNLYAGTNAIELETGLGEFLPDNDGQRVTLTGQDLAIEVKTPPGQAIAVEGKPAGVAVAVSGPVTDAQMRAAAVPVSGPVTDAQMRATAVPVSGPVTDAQMRAAAVPVSGPVTDAQMRAAAVPVSGPVTDAQMRAAPLDVKPVIGGTATPGAEITGSGAIPANAGRRFLHLLTDAANTGFYWTGGAVGSGLKIGAGREIVLETKAAVTLTATVPGDKITFLQIEA